MQSEPLIIDTKMHGQDRLTAAYVVSGELTALVETGPKSTVHNVRAALDGFGIDRLDWIIVTHIHLDHAGAAGTLAADFPDARVAVHEVGAPHLADPKKLWASAARIYGDAMDRLWGGIDPIDADRITVLNDGDKIDLGGRSLQAVETPGHAYHHHAYLDDTTGILFAGDALGIKLPDAGGAMRPATPPPEFHLEKAIESIQKIKTVGADSLWPTHFGPSDAGVNETCDEAIAVLNQWAEWVRGGRERSSDLDEVTAFVRSEARAKLEAELPEQLVERMEQATSYWMNTWGYMRYLDKFE